MTTNRILIIFCIVTIAFIAFINIRFGHAQQLEITAEMEWQPHQSGILVWHTASTVCIHSTAGYRLPKRNDHPAFVDHGNYVALRAGKYIYWVDKEPIHCASNGAESVPVIKKSWVCDVDCEAR